jgi:hypothetical protein
LPIVVNRFVRWVPGLLLAAAAGRSGPVRAAEPPTPEQVLDPATRKLNGNQLVVDGFGGVYLGGSVGHSFLAGGRATYFPIRHIGIGAAYGYSHVFNGDGLDTIRDPSVHIVNGQLETPLVAALRLGRRHLLELDLYGLFGAGAMRIADRWQPLGLVGGGVRIHPRIRWLAVRVDVLTFLHHTQRDDGKVFDSDVAFTLGLSFILPPGPKR